MINKREAIFKIGRLLEDGLVSDLLQEINNDIALEIVETPPLETAKREELYQLTQAVKRLNEKLQEYVNDYNSQEEI